ncbi:MAG: CBS domain-containing protein, partial [Peptococcaceae bacterium]|nr:CBS domain-containing protein [Peptococcaceae bacterium]
LLVERIKRNNIGISPLEATVLAMGVYHDTGSLVFPNTTVRDVGVVAFLLANGANLSVVAEFLDRPFTLEQRLLLKELITETRHEQVNGFNILIAYGQTEKFVGGLSILTYKLVELERPDATFAVVKMANRVYVVARSNVPEINVNEIVGVFGGKGHDSAASAVVKNADRTEVGERLLESIRSKTRPSITAAAIMQQPVKTIDPDSAIDQAALLMLRYGYNGLPVLKDEKVIGIVSRRDVEKATRHGLGNAPVKAYMTTRLVFVEKDTPLAALRDTMIKHDIGRLPVLDDGKLVGIVTRTDILKSLHGDGVFAGMSQTDSGKIKPYSSLNITEQIRRSLAPDYLEILRWTGDVATSQDVRIFAAGGIVRDLLLGLECTDVDLVVEGDGIQLAKELSRKHQGYLRVHAHFGTAKVFFPNGCQVDVTSSRVEYYHHPAAMPEVETSTLSKDLYRRDFTINAMALSLNKGSFGDVMDYFGGKEDLERGHVRVLHNLSFVEDPLRMLRAVRFEQRYYMQIEPHTRKLLDEAVDNDMLSKVSKERLWEELKNIFSEARPGLVLNRISELKLWHFLFPGVDPVRVRPVLIETPRSVSILRSWYGIDDFSESWLIYFLIVLHHSGWNVAKDICKRYNINKTTYGKIAIALGCWRDFLNDLLEPYGVTMSHLARQAKLLPREAYPLIVCYLPNNAAKRRFRSVINTVNNRRPVANGKDLQAMGYVPGPLFKKAMNLIWQARLNGLVNNVEEEMAYLERYMPILTVDG